MFKFGIIVPINVDYLTCSKMFFLGDHYIHIKIDVPKELDYKQKAILQAYAEIESTTPGTVKGFTYKKDGSRAVMEDEDGLVADIKEIFEVANEKPKDEVKETDK